MSEFTILFKLFISLVKVKKLKDKIKMSAGN